MPAEVSDKTPLETKEISISGFPVRLEVAPSGAKIPILSKLEEPEHYRGPSEFQVVVDFRDVFVRREMRNQHVPPTQQWSSDNPPPPGITILEFSNPEVSQAIQAISAIAQEDFYGDKAKCQNYYDMNRNVFRNIERYSSVDLNSVYFMGLIRAGVVAGQMLGVPVERQMLVHTKRLHLKGEREGDIAVGITYVDPGKTELLEGQHVLIADPAGATFSSIVGNLTYLVDQGVRPTKVSIWNTVVSHRGALFAIEVMRELGLDGEIISGGYSSGMNGLYYLETKDRTPSVRDAGDGLDRFLPDELRLLTTS